MPTGKIATNNTIIVDINGKGDCKSVQAKIDSVPQGVIIHVRKGVYTIKFSELLSENLVSVLQNEAPTGAAYTSQNQSVAALVGADKYTTPFLITRAGTTLRVATFMVPLTLFLVTNYEIFVISDKSIGSWINCSSQWGKRSVYGAGDQVYIGRPKGAYSRVLYADTYFSKTIVPQGWTNWSYDGTTE
ncbi:hypothetical protein RJ641_004386 [Dillenia turbinata]|uniref:Pectinesterase n=1 Tax=Dillenia turbinata TaxID=194707 RepID=A0AAN8VIY4_9MAGN